MNNAALPVPRMFVDALCRACDEVFSRSLATEWQFELAEAVPQEGSTLSVEIARADGKQKLAIELSQPHAAKIIEKIMGEPVDPNETLSEDQAPIVQSVLEESCTAALAQPQLKLSGPVTASVTQPDWEAAATAFVTGADEDSGPITLAVHINAELLAAIAATVASAPAASERQSRHTDRSDLSDENLGLVMDVELDLTLCFGRQHMPLKDILHLAPGSVVELDREVQEPVDLLLADKVIARGEVVIVDGNYGLRITEVCNSAS